MRNLVSVGRNVFTWLSIRFPQMTSNLGDGEQALVDLKLQDFRFLFTKSDPWTKHMEVSLQSLIMEDLLQVSVSE